MKSIQEFDASATKNVAACAGNTSATWVLDLKNAGLALLAGLQALGRAVCLNARSWIAGSGWNASLRDPQAQLLERGGQIRSDNLWDGPKY
jgi:hypothetical protein